MNCIATVLFIYFKLKAVINLFLIRGDFHEPQHQSSHAQYRPSIADLSLRFYRGYRLCLHLAHDTAGGAKL